MTLSGTNYCSTCFVLVHVFDLDPRVRRGDASHLIMSHAVDYVSRAEYEELREQLTALQVALEGDKIRKPCMTHTSPFGAYWKHLMAIVRMENAPDRAHERYEAIRMLADMGEDAEDEEEQTKILRDCTAKADGSLDEHSFALVSLAGQHAMSRVIEYLRDTAGMTDFDAHCARGYVDPLLVGADVDWDSIRRLIRARKGLKFIRGLQLDKRTVSHMLTTLCFASSAQGSSIFMALVDSLPVEEMYDQWGYVLSYVRTRSIRAPHLGVYSHVCIMYMIHKLAIKMETAEDPARVFTDSFVRRFICTEAWSALVDIFCKYQREMDQIADKRRQSLDDMRVRKKQRVDEQPSEE